MKKIFLTLALCIVVGSGFALYLSVMKPDKQEPGYIDVDKRGYFLNIAASNERVYFPSDSKDIPKLHEDKVFVRVGAIISQEENGIYATENWVIHTT
jgi:hypothetical protein